MRRGGGGGGHWGTGLRSADISRFKCGWRKAGAGMCECVCLVVSVCVCGAYSQRAKMFDIKPPAILYWPVKKERKPNWTHVDHSQLDDLFSIWNPSHQCCGCLVAQALGGFKTSSLLVYKILNGKGGLTSCGLHEYSLASVPSFFSMSSQ